MGLLWHAFVSVLLVVVDKLAKISNWPYKGNKHVGIYRSLSSYHLNCSHLICVRAFNAIYQNNYHCIIIASASERSVYSPQQSTTKCIWQNKLWAPSYCRNSSINFVVLKIFWLRFCISRIPVSVCLSRILSIPHSFSCHRNRMCLSFGCVAKWEHSTNTEYCSPYTIHITMYTFVPLTLWQIETRPDTITHHMYIHERSLFKLNALCVRFI